MRGQQFSPQRLGPGQADEVVAVLCDAFRDYPVMRFVAGPQEPYEERLHCLVGIFVAGRIHRDHPVLGLRGAAGDLLAVITMTPRGEHPPPEALKAFAEQSWARLGAETKRRYDAMVQAWSSMPDPGECWHVNMLGVRHGHRGHGHAARLLEAATALAAEDPGCRGLVLTTEDPINLDFYRAKGFQLAGEARVPGGPETWMLVRDVR
jgi:GNAT superfamily N-acetyltransferase